MTSRFEELQRVTAYGWEEWEHAWLQLPEERRGELWPAVEALVPSLGDPVTTAHAVLALALGQLQEERC
jgi:hypothetical protein